MNDTSENASTPKAGSAGHGAWAITRDSNFLGLVLPAPGTTLRLVSSSTDLVTGGSITLVSITDKHVELRVHMKTQWPLPDVEETDIVDQLPNGIIQMVRDDDDPMPMQQTESPSAANNRIAFKDSEGKKRSFAWDMAKKQLTVVLPKGTFVFGY